MFSAGARLRALHYVHACRSMLPVTNHITSLVEIYDKHHRAVSVFIFAVEIQQFCWYIILRDLRRKRWEWAMNIGRHKKNYIFYDKHVKKKRGGVFILLIKIATESGQFCKRCKKLHPPLMSFGDVTPSSSIPPPVAGSIFHWIWELGVSFCRNLA